MKIKCLKNHFIILLIAIFTCLLLPNGNKNALAATYSYNADAAIAYAKNHCENESQMATSTCTENWLCAEFVANCLKAGGFNISGYTATVNAKAQGEYMQQYGAKASGKITNEPIKDNFSLALSKGDIIYLVYNDTVSASGHVLLYSGEKDSNGNLLFYAHNSRKNKQTYSITGQYLTATTEIYAIILDKTNTAVVQQTELTSDQINTQIKNVYSKALSLSGMSSFDGWCGSYVQYQLRALGITSSSDSDIKGNGNKMYTNALEGTTSKGYNKTKYSGNSCLSNIISANSGKNVYNIFISWTHQYGYTNSNPGAGHVTFIHAILNNNVYFSESYDSTHAKEGAPQSCSISTFMSRYNNSYGNAIGAVHFTLKNYPTIQGKNPDNYPVLTRDLVYKSGVTVKTGDDVKYLQSVLLHLGYSIDVDGSYGPSSVKIIQDFQKNNNLTIDGMVGPDTRSKINEVWANKKHTWDSGSIATNATHYATGLKNYKCVYCEATKTETIPIIPHSYGGWQNHNTNQHKRTCSCGDTQYQNHTWNNGEISKNATHFQSGIKTYTCSSCNATKSETIPIIPHNYSGWQNHDTNQHKRTCGCGDTQYQNHTWNNGEISKNTTHFQSGIKTYTCTGCKATKTETIPIIQHNYGDFYYLDEQYHQKICSCNSKISEEHQDSDWIIDYEATCTTEGKKHKYCSICQHITKEEVIPIKEHTIVKDCSVEATCTKTGLTEGSHCSVCNKVIVAQQIVDKTAHNHTSIKTEPTCIEEGFTTYTCQCGDTYVSDYINPLNHDYDNNLDSDCNVCGNIREIISNSSAESSNSNNSSSNQTTDVSTSKNNSIENSNTSNEKDSSLNNLENSNKNSVSENEEISNDYHNSATSSNNQGCTASIEASNCIIIFIMCAILFLFVLRKQSKKTER